MKFHNFLIIYTIYNIEDSIYYLFNFIYHEITYIFIKNSSYQKDNLLEYYFLFLKILYNNKYESILLNFLQN